MSFCCKKPQAHAINPDADGLRQQFCVEYLQTQGLPAAGRPAGAESLSVAGARSGRVVTNPIRFRSLGKTAGVSDDGKLYCWGGPFLTAMRYQNSHARPVERQISQQSTTPASVLPASPTQHSDDRSGVFQVGSDSNWDSVVDSDDGRILATKADGSLWAFGNWQSGVFCQWGSDPAFTADIKPQAFRAKLSSSIASIKTDFDESSDYYRFGLPVWFTAEPQSAAVQKVRLHQRSASNRDADVAIAGSEPGSGASVVPRLRAKIDVGSIRSISVTSGGSGYTTTTRTVTLAGSEGSGSGATAFAVVTNGSISSVVITNPGQGYKHPVAATSAGASFSVAEPRQIVVTAGGSGYTTVPSVAVQPAAGEYPGASGATARVSKMSRCGIASFEVQAGGARYTTATAVESRTGATATAVVNAAGVITSWNLTSAGSATYSPLDTEPLKVTITGDGEGATATAVPAGSSIEEVEVVENPEVWSRPPLLVFSGGGGQGAAAVVQGVIGRLDFEVQHGGTGYTKTSFFGVGFGLPYSPAPSQSERAHYAPCVTVPANQDVVGGRNVGGSIIVGEAMFSPSSIASIDQDAAEFCNPYRSPYRSFAGVTTTNGVTAPDQSLRGHHFQSTRLTVASQGTVHPFERILSVLLSNQQTEQNARELVEQTIVAYLRGPGHSRHPLTVDYVPGTLAPPQFKVSLTAPVQFSQPPALCVEYLGRPHRDSAVALLSQNAQTAEVVYQTKANAKPWWAFSSVNNTTKYRRPFYEAGAVEVTGESGAYRRYRVVDGVLVSEENAGVEVGNPPPTGVSMASAPVEYLGPVEERIDDDPSRSWSQPSDAQRIHFFFPTEGVPARGLAEAVYDASLQHPVVGPVSLLEPGAGYTEEPEANLYLTTDPLPASVGLPGCTSMGFSGSTAFAVSQGSLHWWGEAAGVVANSSAALVSGSEPPASSGAAARYAWRLANAIHLRPWDVGTSQFLQAKPGPVGGHLSFSPTGSVTSPGIQTEGKDYSLALQFMRLPRPSYGNRMPVFNDLFFDWPLMQSSNWWEAAVQYNPLLPGSQTSSGLLWQYLPWVPRPADHGFGYEGSPAVEYVGPGLAPHTISLNPSVVPNGIVRVSAGGLLKHSSGKWFSADVRTGPRTGGPDPARPRTITRTSTGQAYGFYTETVTVVDDPVVPVSRFAIVARTAGQGYRVSQTQASISRTGYTAVSTASAANGGASAQDVQVSGSTSSLFVVSSYGGLLSSRADTSFLVKSGTSPPTATINGGGQGAIVETTEWSDPRTPFTPYCFDALSDTADPAGVLAVDASGRLRVVSDRWLFEPEAFKDFPAVARIAVGAGVLYPHEDCGSANYIVSDADGGLWGVRLDSSTTTSGVFLLSSPGAPYAPIALAPLAASLTNPGDGYDYPVKVDVSQPAEVARGTTTIDGRVVGVGVIDGGSGYKTPPAVSFASGVAAAEAEIAGPVQSISVTAGGSGYRLPPRVRFSTPGIPAQATAVLQNGQVQSVSINSGGMYRQAPQVFFDPVSDIASIGVTAGGQGYSTSPAVIIDGGATATAQVSCSVVRVPLVSAGSGYTATPVVTFAGGGGSGAAAQAILNPANGTIVRIDVLNGGSGYTSPPTVSLSGGGGSGAMGYAEIEGFVSSITLGGRGSGYERPPAIVLSGGGGTGATATAAIEAIGSGAAATATINGSVVAVRVTQSNADIQRPPVVSCVRAIPAVAGDTDAVVKAVILGRPQSVTVLNGGSGYCNPFFSTALSPGEKQRTPSRHIRRPTVSAKGSFHSLASGASSTAASVVGGAASSFPALTAKDGERGATGFGINHWLNTYPLLGMAELQGGNSDTGGSVSSVAMPQFVVGLNVTNAGSGYTPNTFVAIRVGTAGTLDNRFRLFNNPLATGTTVARAYIGSDGRIAGVVHEANRPLELFGGIAAYTSSPTFTLASGNGAVAGVLGHPLQCYHAPQVLFDGAIEMDADMSLTLAGACVDGNGTLPRACCGDEEFPYWVGTVWSGVIRNSLLTSAIFLNNRRPDLRLRLVGTVAGFNRRSNPTSWSSDDQSLRTNAFGFYSTPPQLIVEDEKGSGATITVASLPASGKATLSPWVESCFVSSPGAGYTLGARLRIVGGRPLAWDNPASATVTFGNDGRIASLTLQQGGKGYTSPPAVYIVGDGSGATAVVDSISPDTGAVTAVRIVSRGVGYTSATVVFVDKETTASETIARVCDLLDRKYAVILEGCKIESATIPPERRRERTTLAVREVFSAVEVGPSDSVPADYKTSTVFSSQYLDIEAAGYRLHGVYLSDGRVEYVRVENHFGELPPTPVVVTITPASDVQPQTAATAIATIPACDNVLSSAAANVTTDFPPYQLG